MTRHRKAEQPREKRAAFLLVRDVLSAEDSHAPPATLTVRARQRRQHHHVTAHGGRFGPVLGELLVGDGVVVAVDTGSHPCRQECPCWHRLHPVSHLVSEV